MDWARRRIDEFEAEVDGFLATKPYHVSKHAQPRCEPYYAWFTEYRFRVTAEVPITVRLRAGDAIHALRASVDNLVWGVGQVFGAKDSLTLPFRDNATEFAKVARGVQLDRLPVPLQDWIENQQIYRQPNQDRSLLHSLSRLWGRDKHRVPVMTGNSLACVTITDKGNVSEISVDYPPALEDGDKIMHTTNEVDFEPEFTFHVAFKEIGKVAGAFFRDVDNHIRKEVIPTFEPFLV
jgi:hypothetical protein